jgi:hypothetical protein
MSKVVWRFVYLHGAHPSTWARLKQSRGWSAIPEDETIALHVAAAHHAICRLSEAIRAHVELRSHPTCSRVEHEWMFFDPLVAGLSKSFHGWVSGAFHKAMREQETRDAAQLCGSRVHTGGEAAHQ